MDPVISRPVTCRWREQFVEELGGLVLEPGTPRAVVRVLGWLVVSDPPEQTAQDIGDCLDLSAGSVSAATRMLVEAGMIERTARPGDRHNYYRLRANSWERALEAHVRSVVRLREVAERALKMAGAEADERLRVMRDTNAWFEAQLLALVHEPAPVDGSERAPRALARTVREGAGT